MKLAAVAVVLAACDQGSPSPSLEPPAIDTPPQRELVEQHASALDRCVDAVSGAPSTVVGAVVRMTDGTRVQTRDHAFEPASYPLFEPIPPRTRWIDASLDRESTVVTLRDERGPLAQYRFATPADPAFDNSGAITKTGTRSPCPTGIRDVRWWDVSGDAIVAVRYSLSDMCKDVVWDVCSVAVLPVPKDLPL